MVEKIEHILRLQEDLNILTNGDAYKSGTTQSGDEISWTRCIVMETFSLASLTKWKHWKDLHLSVDWDDIKVEIADIFHFVVSYLQQEYNDEQLTKMIEQFSSYKPQLVASEYMVRDEAEKLIYYTIMIQNNNEINSNDAANVLLGKFFTICSHASIDFEELYILYVAKNSLNKIRQEKGYKDGGYSKLWGNMSDIDVMFHLIEANTDVNLFYEKFLESYETKA